MDTSAKLAAPVAKLSACDLIKPLQGHDLHAACVETFLNACASTYILLLLQRVFQKQYLRCRKSQAQIHAHLPGAMGSAAAAAPSGAGWLSADGMGLTSTPCYPAGVAQQGTAGINCGRQGAALELGDY